MTIDHNKVSQVVLCRIGFSHEDTHREHVFRSREYYNIEYYGLLISEERYMILCDLKEKTYTGDGFNR